MAVPGNLKAVPWPTGKVTILYTDLKDSSKTNREMRDAAYRSGVLTPHCLVLQEEIARQQGRIFQDKGDGVVAVFPFALNALDAALAIQRRWGRGDGTLGVRMGLHSTQGEVAGAIIKGNPPPYSTNDLNFASRIEAPADAAQILLSGTTFAALNQGDGLPFEIYAHSNRFLKGFAESPEILYDVLYDGREPREPGVRWLPRWYGRALNSFVGRDEWLLTIRRWLTDSKYPLFVLRGFGGVGKTRLVEQAVLELGAQFPGGIHFVSLETIPTEAATVEAVFHLIVAAADAPEELGQAFERVDTREQAKLQLIKHLRANGRASLLILDNWESVAHPEITGFVNELLRSVPSMRFLITTRVLWGGITTGEQHDLEGMRIPQNASDDFSQFEGSEFFLSRARLRHAEFNTTSDTDRASVVEILQATQGLAFAIELIAARVYDYRYRLGDLAKQLKARRSQLLSTQEGLGDATGPAARHSSLDACIAWSIDHIPNKPGSEAFVRLGLFPESFRVERAEEICDIAEDWLFLYDRASLLVQASDGSYRLLPIVREYAANKLEHNDATRLKFVTWYSNLLRSFYLPKEKQLNINEGSVREVLQAERADILAALSEAANLDAYDDLSMFQHYGTFLNRTGAWQEANQLFLTLQTTFTKSNDPRGVAWSIHERANVMASKGQWDEAIQTYQESRKLYTQIGDLLGEAASLHGLTNVLASKGQWDEAIQSYRDSLAILRQIGDLQGEAASLHGLANVLSNKGQWDEAIQAYRDSLAILRQIGDLQGEAASLHGLANVLNDKGQWDEAIQTYQESLAIERQIDNIQGEAASLASIASPFYRTGKVNEAIDSLKDAIDRLMRLGDLVTVGICLRNLAFLQSNSGRRDEAIVSAREAVRITEQTQDENGKHEGRELLAALEGQG